MQVAYQTALAAVCVEGILFIILAVTGLRLRLIRLVPKSIMLATSAGAHHGRPFYFGSCVQVMEQDLHVKSPVSSHEYWLAHAGIGLFLAFIGLQSQEGLGIISYDIGTLVSLGGCPARSQASFLYMLLLICLATIFPSPFSPVQAPWQGPC